MEDFDEEERYACAAIFTLALHQCQVDCGAAGDDNSQSGTWGAPLGSLEEPEAPERAEERADVAAARWSAFWGWDCCGPGGILEQLYTALKLPERCWSGLTRLPEVGGNSKKAAHAYMKLVSSYIKMLDPQLPTSHLEKATPVAVNEGSERSLPAKARELQDARLSGASDLSPLAEARDMPEFLEGVASDADSDLEDDLANVHLKNRIQCQASDGAMHSDPQKSSRTAEYEGRCEDHFSGDEECEEGAEAELPLLSAPRPFRTYSKAEALSQALQRWSPSDIEPPDGSAADAAAEREEALAVPSASAMSPEGQQASDETREPAIRETAERQERAQMTGQLPGLNSISEREVSRKALAVLWVLLEACTLPKIASAEPAVENSQEAGDAKSVDEGAAIVGIAPQARWYDARSRSSLRLIAAWLRVPWSMVANFESLLVYQLLLPGGEKGKKEMTAWEHSIRAAKIGAATLTIGAIFALTGGVAAPAIAGGVGAAIGLAGGSTAVATGVTGFLGTAAGGAVIASTVGAAGVGLSAPHVARRIEERLPTSAEPSGDKATRECQAEKTANSEDVPTSSNTQAALATQHTNETAVRMSAENARLENARLANQGESHTAALWDSKPLQPSAAPASGQSDECESESSSNSASVALPLGHKENNCGSELAAEVSASEDVGHISMPNSRQSSHHKDLQEAAAKAPQAAEAGIKSSESSNGPEQPPPSTLDATKAQPGKEETTRSQGLMTYLTSSRQINSILDKQQDSQRVESATRGSNFLLWWRWKEKDKQEKDPPLLLAPVAPNRKVEDMRMSITIGVSGWISRRSDFQEQWLSLARCQKGSEAFTLVWESQELKDLNNAIVDFAASQAGQEAAKWVLQHFFFTGLIAALAWPALIYSAVQLIDTAWAVALHRAQKAGRLLAHVLASGAHGNRPVTLVGNSMGARLIFHCLLELARLKAKGLVEHVCLLGTPVALRPERWAMARSVVAGRLVNGFSRKDWLLAVVYRGANGFIKDAAGLCPAPFPGIENVNLTAFVQGHFEYIDKTEEILDLINLYN